MVFHTNIWVTLLKCGNLKTLLFKLIIFKKTCAWFKEKSQIGPLITFDQYEVFIIK